MNKYREVCPPGARPALSFDLSGPAYPERMNAARTLLEDARARGWGARPAYYHRDRTITYDGLHAAVHRYAEALRRLGVAPGDRVLARIPDTPELVYVMLAAHAVGAVAIPTYIQLRADDLVYRLRDAEARYAVADADHLDELAAAAGSCPGLVVAVLPEDPTGRFRSLSGLLPDEAPPASYHDAHAEDLTLIVYTSGSTGRPKGACHAHRDMIAAADAYWGGCVAPTPDDVIGGPPAVPFALGYGLFVVFPLRFGSAAVLEPDKSVAAALAAIERRGVTIFTAVVSYYAALAAEVAGSGRGVAPLRRALTGGEPLSPEIERAWCAATGGVLEQFLGTSEMFHVFLTSSHPTEPARAETLGRAVPGYDVAAIDPETFAPVADGAQGLLAVRGPTGTVYWRNPEKQAEAVRGGWNVFPDLVVRGEDGFFSYVARHDEMIVSAGYNISPIEVETALLRHEAVAECAAVAAPDPTGRRSAIVKAYVVTAPGHEGGAALAAALQDHAKAVAPPYMYPRAVAFLDALPKTVNGKVLRSELRARARAGG